MKSKLLKIVIVFIILLFTYETVVSALSFTASIVTGSTTVAENTEFTVTVKVSNLDVGQNGINALEGYLEYDTKVFQPITESSVEGLSGWKADFFPDNKKVVLTKSTFTKTEESVFQVTFRTKQDVAGSTGAISFKSIIASNSADEISATDIATQVTVGTTPTNTPTNDTNTGNTNKPSTINTTVNTNSNNKTNNTNVNTENINTDTNSNSNNISTYTNTNTNSSSESDIPKTGVEDTILLMIFVILVIAFIFYIKIERINKDMNKR